MTIRYFIVSFSSLDQLLTFACQFTVNNSASTISGGAIINANGDMTIVGDSSRVLDNATINNHAGYIATWSPDPHTVALMAA